MTKLNDRKMSGRAACTAGRVLALACLCAAAAPGVARAGKKDVPVAAPSRAAPHVGGFAMPHAGGGLFGGASGGGGGVHMPGSMAGGGVHMPGSMAGGGVHVPGSMAGGAHVPSAMAGGAHVPGSMGAGAHVPGSMGAGAHVPGSMGAGAHMPGSVAGGAHVPGSMAAAHVPGAATTTAHLPAGGAHPVLAHGAPAHTETAHAGAPGSARPGAVAQAAPVHAGALPGGHGGGHGGGLAQAGARPGEHVGEHGALAAHERPGEALTARPVAFRGPGLRADPRLGGAAALHTHGLEAGMAAHREPRPFLRADAHRDLARDHEFVAHHAADFHTRDVRGFSTRELAVWRGGVWRNEWHYGRRGWWWDVGGVWYGYDNPIWPYPLVVAPLTVYDADVVVGPDLSVAEDVPAYAGPPDAAPGDAPPGADAPQAQGGAPGIPPLPPAPVGYYSCGDPNGTFPGVGACDKPWDLVDAAPPPDVR